MMRSLGVQRGSQANQRSAYGVLARNKNLESELAALRAKLNPEWLERPDGEGWWWHKSLSAKAYPAKVTADKFGKLFTNGVPVEGCLGRWRRIHIGETT